MHREGSARVCLAASGFGCKGTLIMRHAGNRAVTLVAVIIGVGSTSRAEAQWTVTNLHPSGASNSYAYGVSEGQQIGTAVINGANCAGLWTGSAASWMKFTKGTQGYATRSGKQVGIAEVGGWNHASVWSSAAGSWQDIHPTSQQPTPVLSQAHGVDGIQVVGVTTQAVGAQNHAALWNGAVWTDLHPAGALWSWARDVHNGQQVGWTSANGADHASLWTGTALSWVDLSPAESTGSFANSVHAGHQAGSASFGGFSHAGWWSGTASSWIDLHPAGATDSSAGSIYGQRQAGSAIIGGVRCAGYWTGTSASWVNLSALLAGSWGNAFARGIWDDGTTLYVAGYARNLATNRDEAILWTRPVPLACPGDLNGDSQVDDADFVIFAAAYNLLVCEDPSMPAGCPADLTHDGLVDDGDFVEFVQAYDRLICP